MKAVEKRRHIFFGALLAFCFLAQGSSAEEKASDNPFMHVGIQQQDDREGTLVVGKDIPYTRSPVKDYIKRYRFEIDSDKFYGLYNIIFKKIKDRKKILHKTFDISVLMRPNSRLFKAVDHLYLASAYITQIVFPKGMKITDAVASFPTTLFDFDRNELRLRPSAGFSDGNVVVHLSDGTKNYSVNLLVEDYVQKHCIKQKGKYYCKDASGENSGLYSQAFENVSLVYKYKKVKPLDDVAAIHLYQKLYGKKLDIKKDGGFVAFEYGGITYYIYRNDKFGNVYYKKHKYLVKK